MSQSQNIITQVSSENLERAHLISDPMHNDVKSDDMLIHLNSQGNHYYITKKQLMSFPESLLLCLFPSGVFMDIHGQVVTNLTSDDEIYIGNFPPECFMYIMDIYTCAQYDLENYPVSELFLNNKPKSNNHKSFFGFTSSSFSQPQESDILHEKPTVIVLREDLDYYCVPNVSMRFTNDEQRDLLLQQIMAKVKTAAGSYLTKQTSIFKGLCSSNHMKGQVSSKDKSSPKLGPAEQHLKDMLCSSGFNENSIWGNRSQEPNKTIISSLSLCRLANETTQEFRDKLAQAKKAFEDQSQHFKPHVEYDIKRNSSSHLSLLSSELTLSPSSSSSPHLAPVSSRSDQKRLSRLSALADNVRSRSVSRQRSKSRQRANHIHPTSLYELVPKPEINSKLLLFWKKPARKCWWGKSEIDLEIELHNCVWDPLLHELKFGPDDGPDKDKLVKIKIPVKLHIRRVWTLELSIIGMY